MPTDPRLRRLLEEVLDSGASPEDATRECPELLSPLLTKLREFRAVEAQVEALFPDSSASGGAVPAPVTAEAELPRIPGYDIESLLGRGGMGVVYKGRHLKLNRPVAIKMLLAGTCATAIERERFLREAEAAARLQHPNIVPVYDVGDHAGRLYFTMEYVEGGTLANQLAGVPQPPQQAAELLATLADAVHAAHERGIVHRDLKPSNVLLTAAGIPKVNDFGLARLIEGTAPLTLSGAPMGTPSYMSPEQARGESTALGPTVDIYALGAILYELLTGRPPFRAESPSATLQQVIFQEAVPPTRLNASVPRDLETICLKCLQKDPRRRYARAADLRDDLRQFLRNEPIAARPVSRPERILRWTRRNPVGAALLATAAGLVAVTAAFGMKEIALAAERRLERAQWKERLQFVLQLQQQGRFPEARTILGRVPDGGAGDLRRDIQSAIADLDIAEKLEQIRTSRGRFQQGGGIDYDESSRRYATIFREAGLGTFEEDPADVAPRVKGSTVNAALIAALDDWAACALPEPRAWILGVARQADPDAWRDRVRDQAQWADVAGLQKLADDADVRRQPVTIMVAMGTRWRRLGGDPTGFLKRVHQVHPDDFWLNFELGVLLGAKDCSAAIGYDRAAVALRPDASAAHYNLAFSLWGAGQPADGILHFQRTLELEPDHTWGHLHLGQLLFESGRLDEAFSHFQRVIKLEPGSTEAKVRLREIQLRRGHADEAAASWAKALDSATSASAECDGYAELCLILKREDEYRRVCEKLLTRFGSTNNPRECEWVSRACLLAPPSAEHLQQSAALIDRALAADKTTYNAWLYPYFLFAKGLAEYRSGRFERALAICEGEAAGVLGPAPKFVAALAHHRLGNVDAARQALAKANEGFDWKGDPVRQREGWMYIILRREALEQIGSLEK